MRGKNGAHVDIKEEEYDCGAGNNHLLQMSLEERGHSVHPRKTADGSTLIAPAATAVNPIIPTVIIKVWLNLRTIVNNQAGNKADHTPFQAEDNGLGLQKKDRQGVGLK